MKSTRLSETQKKLRRIKDRVFAQFEWLEPEVCLPFGHNPEIIWYRILADGVVYENCVESGREFFRGMEEFSFAPRKRRCSRRIPFSEFYKWFSQFDNVVVFQSKWFKKWVEHHGWQGKWTHIKRIFPKRTPKSIKSVRNVIFKLSTLEENLKKLPYFRAETFLFKQLGNSRGLDEISQEALDSLREKIVKLEGEIGLMEASLPPPRKVYSRKKKTDNESK